MLTGIVPPTSGSSEILGFNTWSQWNIVQKLIGLCPQQSILYNILTVKEHLSLYGKLKGVLTQFDLDLEINTFLKCMDMTDLADVAVKDLSEGLKRRLCVALAFIGGSKVVILDEPTSGIDQYVRIHLQTYALPFYSSKNNFRPVQIGLNFRPVKNNFDLLDP